MGISSDEIKERLIHAFASELVYEDPSARENFFSQVSRFYYTGFQDFWAIDRLDDYMSSGSALSIDVKLTVSAACRFLTWLELELAKDEDPARLSDHSLAVDYVAKRIGTLIGKFVNCWKTEGSLLNSHLPQAAIYNDNEAIGQDGQQFIVENIWLGVFYLFLVLGCGTELKDQLENLQTN